MNFNEFTDQIMELLTKKLGREYSICRQEVIKNNGVIWTGVSVAKIGENIAPTCYLENFYELYRNEKAELEEIVDCIIEKVNENVPDEMTDFRFYFDFNKVSDRVIYKLINYEKNEKLLKDIPHRKYLDLAIVYEYYIKSNEGIRATILIHENHLKMWGRKEEDLYQAAKENTPQLLPTETFDLRDVFGMNELFEEKEKTEIPSMTVLTNKMNLFGATVVLYENALLKLSEEQDCDFIILPSSVHEIILLPFGNNMEKSHFEEMVKEVNDTELEEQEILSYHVYYYSRNENAVVIWGNEEKSVDETSGL